MAGIFEFRGGGIKFYATIYISFYVLYRLSKSTGEKEGHPLILDFRFFSFFLFLRVSCSSTPSKYARAASAAVARAAAAAPRQRAGRFRPTRGAAAPRPLSGRGLAYWTDGKSARILYVTPGYRLIALDAQSGARIRSFGDSGAVDLKQNMDVPILPDLETGEIGYQGAPTVARNVVIIGAAFREGGSPKTYRNNKGDIRGFDVRTGKRLWTFHTIPRKGEFGYDSWLNGSADNAGNTGVWTQIGRASCRERV